MSRKDKAALFREAISLGLPIEDDYMYRELGIEKPASYDAMKKEMQQRREAAAALGNSFPQQSGTATNRAEGFFADSPDYRALNW